MVFGSLLKFKSVYYVGCEMDVLDMVGYNVYDVVYAHLHSAM